MARRVMRGRPWSVNCFSKQPMIKLDSAYGAAERALDQALARAGEARGRLAAVRGARAANQAPVREPRTGAALASAVGGGSGRNGDVALAGQANQSGRRVATLLG